MWWWYDMMYSISLFFQGFNVEIPWVASAGDADVQRSVPPKGPAQDQALYLHLRALRRSKRHDFGTWFWMILVSSNFVYFVVPDFLVLHCNDVAAATLAMLIGPAGADWCRGFRCPHCSWGSNFRRKNGQVGFDASHVPLPNLPRSTKYEVDEPTERGLGWVACIKGKWSGKCSLRRRP